MRWRGRRQSVNIEDRRGRRVTRGGLIGGGLGTLALLLLAIYLGVDPSVLLQGTTKQSVETTAEPYVESPGEAEWREQIAVVLAETEDSWNAVFADLGGDYRDLAFFDELERQLGAGGDFARAYVVAHEVGHHVQNLLGISDRVRATQRRVGEIESNQLSVRLELQADCFAGLWAHHADTHAGILETGDAAEALGAASAVGDDRLQRSAGRAVVPDSFTHGSSEQRMRWFRRGFESGSLESCDTFKAADV